MESKLLRIKLKPGSEEKVRSLIARMKADIESVKSEMDQLGYYWDSVFMGDVGDCTYLYIVGKSQDWSKKAQGVTQPTTFRTYYEEFKADCWDESDQLDHIWCPNGTMEFDA